MQVLQVEEPKWTDPVAYLNELPSHVSSKSAGPFAHSMGCISKAEVAEKNPAIVGNFWARLLLGFVCVAYAQNTKVEFRSSLKEFARVFHAAPVEQYCSSMVTCGPFVDAVMAACKKNPFLLKCTFGFPFEKGRYDAMIRAMLNEAFAAVDIKGCDGRMMQVLLFFASWIMSLFTKVPLDLFWRLEVCRFKSPVVTWDGYVIELGLGHNRSGQFLTGMHNQLAFTIALMYVWLKQGNTVESFWGIRELINADDGLLQDHLYGGIVALTDGLWDLNIDIQWDIAGASVLECEYLGAVPVKQGLKYGPARKLYKMLCSLLLVELGTTWAEYFEMLEGILISYYATPRAYDLIIRYVKYLNDKYGFGYVLPIRARLDVIVYGWEGGPMMQSSSGRKAKKKVARRAAKQKLANQSVARGGKKFPSMDRQLEAERKVGMRGVLHMIPGTRDYAFARMSPFKAYDADVSPRIPLAPAEPSAVLKNKLRGVGKTSGTTKFGYVTVNAAACMVNDSVFAVNWTDDSTYTHDYISPVSGTPGTGADASNNTGMPYSATNFNDSAVGGDTTLKSRLVALGLRVRYVGTKLNEGGRVVAVEPPNRGYLANKKFSDLTALKRNASVSIFNSDWHEVVLSTQHVTDTQYLQVNTGNGVWYTSERVGSSLSRVGDSGEYWATSLVIAIESAVAGQPFEWELVTFTEVVGVPAPNPESGSQDPSGASHVHAAHALVKLQQPEKAHTTGWSMGRVLSHVADYALKHTSSIVPMVTHKLLTAAGF
jgi:hypothetical protein